MAKKKHKGKRRLTAKQIAAGFGGKAAQKRARKRRSHAVANPRGKKKKRRANPARYVTRNKIPGIDRKGFFEIQPKPSNRFPTRAEMEAMGLSQSQSRTAADLLVDGYIAIPKEKRELLSKLGDPAMKEQLDEISHQIKELKKATSALSKGEKEEAKAELYKKLVKKFGGDVHMESSANPRKKRKKRKGGKRKHAKRKHAMRKGGKRKASKRKHAKRSSRKGKAKKFKKTIRVKFRKPRKSVTVRISGSVNPSKTQVLLMAAAGYAVSLMVYKLVDGYNVAGYNGANGRISSKLPLGSLGAAAPFVMPLVLPATAWGVAKLAQMASDKVPALQSEKAQELIQGAQMVAMVVGAVGLVSAAISAGKNALPASVAQNKFLSPMLAGVKYFPAPMSGADFGMYPQMGQYHQQPGDFGIIPEGLRGVKYFPRKTMGAVEYFPDGAYGDDMYRESEAGQLAEAEGLGIIPEGLAGADFGEIPSGMGGDDGQMG